MYYIEFTVEGSGYFPFDMLRYDACHPVHESESRQLGEYDRRRRVLLQHRTSKDNTSWRPNDARWQSFGWRVVEQHPARKDAHVRPASRLPDLPPQTPLRNV